MITLLAPTTVDAAAADDGHTTIIEMSSDVLHALKAAVEVAFEDESSVPEHLRAAATQTWDFFVKGQVTT